MSGSSIFDQPGIYPPPYDPEGDLLTGDYLPEYDVAEATPEGVLLKKFFVWARTFSRDILDSYNNWIIYEIASQLAARTVKTKHVHDGKEYDAKFVFEDHVFIKPSYSIGSNTFRLYPENARRLHISYLATLAARPSLYIHAPDPNSNLRPAPMIWLKVKTNTPYQEICKIPAMLGSVLCHLDDITDPEQLAALGVNPDDPLGYFIINGRSKVILNIQKLRLNKIFVLPATPKSTPYCRTTVLTPTGTKQMQIVLGNKYNDIQLQLGSFKKKGEAGTGNKTAEGINILRVIEILANVTRLNVNMAEYGGVAGFFRTIMRQFVAPDRWNKVSVEFVGTEANYENISSDVAYKIMVSFLKTELPSTAPITDIERERTEKLDEMFAEYLFPNIDKNDSTGNMRKIYNLAIMSARLLEYNAGFTEADDRDSWAQNKLDLADRALAQLFRLELVHMKITVQNDIDGTGFQKKDKGKTRAKPTFSFENIAEKFKRLSNEMTSKIVSAFESTNWGKKQNFARNNLTDQLEDHNPIEIISHLTKIDVNTERRTKSILVRGVKPTQAGGVCIDMASDDPSCGIVKNKALTAYVTSNVDPMPLIKQITESKYFSASKTIQTPDYIMVNGVYQGWCNAQIMYKYLVSLRRNGIYRYAEFVNSRNGYLEIFTDGGRPTRPLAVVEENGLLAIDNHNARDKDFQYMLDHGLVEFIGLAEQERMIVAMKPEVLHTRLEQMEKKRATYEAEIGRVARIAQEYGEEVTEYKNAVKSLRIAQDEYDREALPYNYCELHPIAIVGVGASNIPFMNLNPASRIAYQIKMIKQAMAPMGVNPHIHNGTEYVKMGATLPIIRTVTASAIGSDRRPIGNNIMMAVASISGFNQEDALVFSSRIIQSDAFTYIKYIVKDTLVKAVNGSPQTLCLPWFDQSSAHRYHAIGEDGLPIRGSCLKEGDCIIGKIQFEGGKDPSGDRDRMKKESKNVSEYMKIGEYGVVESVRKTDGGEGIYVSVKIRCVCRPGLGDKFSLDPSQKVTIGIVYKEEDMPFDIETGIKPDAIMNPHAFPSRMTMGLLKEMMYGTGLSRKGRSYDATGFQFYDDIKFREMITDFDYFGPMSSRKEALKLNVGGQSPLERYRAKKKSYEKYAPIADISPPALVPDLMNTKIRELLSNQIKKYTSDPNNLKYRYLRNMGTIPPLETPINDKLKEIIIKSMIPDEISPAMKILIDERIRERDSILEEIAGRLDIDRSNYMKKLDPYAGLYGINSAENNLRMKSLYNQFQIMQETLNNIDIDPVEGETKEEAIEIEANRRGIIDNLKKISAAIDHFQLYTDPDNLHKSGPDDPNYKSINNIDDIPDTITVGTQDVIYEIIKRRDNLGDEIRNFEKVFMSGKYMMRSGTTGIVYSSRIFMAPIRIYQMHHIAKNKIQGRGRGKYDEVTRQPQGGRTKHGAVQFGEMDLRAVESHGASAIAHERMCLLSDAYEVPMCIRCGVIATYDPYNNTFFCPLNKTCTSFGRTTIAYVYKYLTQMLASVGYLMTNTTATKEMYPEKMVELRAKRKKKKEYVEKFSEIAVEEGEEENIGYDETDNPNLSEDDDGFIIDNREEGYLGYSSYND